MWIRLKSKITKMFTVRRKVGALVLLVVALATYGWYYYSQKPTVGLIKEAEASQVQLPTVMGLSHFLGEHASFDYPSVYMQTTASPPSGHVIERFSFLAKIDTTEGRKLSLSVNKIDKDTTITQDSAYQLRVVNSQTYHEERETIGSLSITKFTKSDDSEVVYFIPNNNYYAILAVSSSRSGGDFLQDAKSIAASFKWGN